MELDAGSAEIVLLAWARHLGFDDEAFSFVSTLPTARSAERLVREDNEANSITFVRIFGRSALVGPRWAVRAAVGLSDDELSEHSAMLRLSREHGGHGLGTSALLFADDLPLVQPGGDVAISHGHAEAVELEGRCPPDDVNEVHLSRMDHYFTLMDGNESGRKPMACGAYAEWHGFLADLGVLVPPELRRQGLGTLVASIASHEALASGLTLQWRTALDNRGSLALARRLGFVDGGIQTSVLLR